MIALTLDLGQGRELTDVRERALAIGAARAHVLDVRDEFAREYILPALQAGALYEDRYPLATALGRPLIARKLVEVARMEGATTVAHGCNGKANDELRLELGVRALDPAMRYRAARAWGMSRAAEIEYARERRIPIPSTLDSPYTVDTNLWGDRSSAACSKIHGRNPPRTSTLSRDRRRPVPTSLHMSKSNSRKASRSARTGSRCRCSS